MKKKNSCRFKAACAAPGAELSQTSVVSDFILQVVKRHGSLPRNEDCEKSTVQEVARCSRSQMSKCHTDMMNRLVLSSTKRAEQMIPICKRNNCGGAL